MKVYKDVDEVIKATVEIPKEYWKYEELMREKPNFDKSINGAKKVYQRKSYIILKVNKGFIIYNTKKKFEEGHSHLNSFDICKVLIDCSIRNKLPRTKNKYILKSLIRISDDEKYIDLIYNLIDIRTTI